MMNSQIRKVRLLVIVILSILLVNTAFAQSDTIDVIVKREAPKKPSFIQQENQNTLIENDTIYPFIESENFKTGKITYSEKIRFYCVKESITVSQFSSICTQRLNKNHIETRTEFQHISTTLIWSIIRNQKEPIGDLKNVIDNLFNEVNQVKNERLTKMDF